jgi:hypothetical protein
MSAMIDITPEAGFWIIEVRPDILAFPAMAGTTTRAWDVKRFSGETLARARSIAVAMSLARGVAADNEVHARDWPAYCRARSITEALTKVQTEFVDGPDPRD